MANLQHKALTGAIIGAYYEVYNHTSRAYPEYIYERAMIKELQQRGMRLDNIQLGILANYDAVRLEIVIVRA